MEQYLQLLDNILTKGRTKSDRTGHGTKSLFGQQMSFDLSEGFPLVTTRKMFTRGMIEELLWFLRGETNNQSLVDKDVHFWTSWALKEDKYKEVELNPYERIQFYAQKFNKPIDEVICDLNIVTRDFTINEAHIRLDLEDIPRTKLVKVASKGELGPIYGAMWRNWPIGNGSTIDQIQTLVDNLKARPYSRRHIVSGWNPALLPEEGKSHEENILAGKQCLPPCHTLFQFMVEPLDLSERLDQYTHERMEDVIKKFDGIDDAINEYLDNQGVPKDRLSCKLYQRSADSPIGLPVNIASYALFTHMLCHLLNMAPGDYIHSMGDSHIYLNQIDGVKEQLTRTPYPLPTLKINRKVESIFDFKVDDFEFLNYQSHPKIDYPLAV